jgi:hypothetical protein
MSRNEDIEQRLADWLEEGPIGAPDPPIAAALAHARAHPRRRWSAVGHWRNLMSGTNMAQVGPKAPQAGWLYAAAAVLVIVVVVAGGYGILQSTNPGTGIGGPASVAPTATPLPTATPSPTTTTVTGSEDCWQIQAETTVVVDDVKQSRGSEFECTAENSDPRLAGEGTASTNWDDYPDGTEIMWGTRVITNDGGSWRSVWNVKTRTDATTMAFPAVFVGEGGYAGLVAALDVVVSVPGPGSFSGVITPAPPTLTGHETCVTNNAGTETPLEGFTAYRGVRMTCTDTMSDLRVSGTGANEISIDMRLDGSADIWGTYVLANEDGTWEGYWAGTVDEGYTTHRVESLLVGTGDYEGLLYRLSLVSDATDTGYDLAGLIVPRP